MSLMAHTETCSTLCKVETATVVAIDRALRFVKADRLIPTLIRIDSALFRRIHKEEA